MKTALKFKRNLSKLLNENKAVCYKKNAKSTPNIITVILAIVN